jgi:hypothetical protein
MSGAIVGQTIIDYTEDEAIASSLNLLQIGENRGTGVETRAMLHAQLYINKGVMSIDNDKELNRVRACGFGGVCVVSHKLMSEEVVEDDVNGLSNLGLWLKKRGELTGTKNKGRVEEYDKNARIERTPFLAAAGEKPGINNPLSNNFVDGNDALIFTRKTLPKHKKKRGVTYNPMPLLYSMDHFKINGVYRMPDITEYPTSKTRFKIFNVFIYFEWISELMELEDVVCVSRSVTGEEKIENGKIKTVSDNFIKVPVHGVNGEEGDREVNYDKMNYSGVRLYPQGTLNTEIYKYNDLFKEPHLFIISASGKASATAENMHKFTEFFVPKVEDVIAVGGYHNILSAKRDMLNKIGRFAPLMETEEVAIKRAIIPYKVQVPVQVQVKVSIKVQVGFAKVNKVDIFQQHYKNFMQLKEESRTLLLDIVERREEFMIVEGGKSGTDMVRDMPLAEYTKVLENNREASKIETDRHILGAIDAAGWTNAPEEFAKVLEKKIVSIDIFERAGKLSSTGETFAWGRKTITYTDVNNSNSLYEGTDTESWAHVFEPDGLKNYTDVDDIGEEREAFEEELSRMNQLYAVNYDYVMNAMKALNITVKDSTILEFMMIKLRDSEAKMTTVNITKVIDKMSMKHKVQASEISEEKGLEQYMVILNKLSRTVYTSRGMIRSDTYGTLIAGIVSIMYPLKRFGSVSNEESHTAMSMENNMEYLIHKLVTYSKGALFPGMGKAKETMYVARSTQIKRFLLEENPALKQVYGELWSRKQTVPEEPMLRASLKFRPFRQEGKSGKSGKSTREPLFNRLLAMFDAEAGNRIGVKEASDGNLASRIAKMYEVMENGNGRREETNRQMSHIIRFPQGGHFNRDAQLHMTINEIPKLPTKSSILNCPIQFIYPPTEDIFEQKIRQFLEIANDMDLTDAAIIRTIDTMGEELYEIETYISRELSGILRAIENMCSIATGDENRSTLEDIEIIRRKISGAEMTERSLQGLYEFCMGELQRITAIMFNTHENVEPMRREVIDRLYLFYSNSLSERIQVGAIIITVLALNPLKRSMAAMQNRVQSSEGKEYASQVFAGMVRKIDEGFADHKRISGVMDTLREQRKQKEINKQNGLEMDLRQLFKQIKKNVGLSFFPDEVPDPDEVENIVDIINVVENENENDEENNENDETESDGGYDMNVGDSDDEDGVEEG